MPGVTYAVGDENAEGDEQLVSPEMVRQLALHELEEEHEHTRSRHLGCALVQIRIDTLEPKD